MTNEIPYIDYSSGEPVAYYFGPPPVENANLEAMRRSKSKVEKEKRITNLFDVCSAT